MDTIRRRNPRIQGEIGLPRCRPYLRFADRAAGAAIGWFSANGYRVAIPLCDNQPWDLIVEDAEGLQRVQVKTTTARSPYGIFVVHLATRGGNQSFHTNKPFDNTASDLLFVLTDRREVYLIPSSDVKAEAAILLGRKYQAYHQGRLAIQKPPEQRLPGV